MASKDENAIFCPSCGLRVEPGHQFCLGCGAPLSGSTSLPSYSPTSPSSRPIPSTTPPPIGVAPLPTPRKEVNTALIIVNYAVSIIIFIIAVGIVAGVLNASGIGEDSVAILSLLIASSVAGLVGGFVTKQYIPFKVVGAIILVIAGIATLLIFLAFQSAQQSTSPYAALGFAIVLIVVLAFALITTVILLLHAGFSYIGVKLRE